MLPGMIGDRGKIYKTQPTRNVLIKIRDELVGAEPTVDKREQCPWRGPDREHLSSK